MGRLCWRSHTSVTCRPFAASASIEDVARFC